MLEGIKLLTDADDVLIARDLLAVSNKDNQNSEMNVHDTDVNSIAVSSTNIGNKNLSDIKAKYIGKGTEKYEESLLRSGCSQLSHATGIEDIDMLTILGFAHVNSSKFNSAVEIFKAILSVKSDAISALLGLGSSYALTNSFELAIEEFTKVISLDSTVS
jgi:hypothetical protein